MLCVEFLQGDSQQGHAFCSLGFPSQKWGISQETAARRGLGEALPRAQWAQERYSGSCLLDGHLSPTPTPGYGVRAGLWTPCQMDLGLSFGLAASLLFECGCLLSQAVSPSAAGRQAPCCLGLSLGLKEVRCTELSLQCRRTPGALGLLVPCPYSRAGADDFLYIQIHHGHLVAPRSPSSGKISFVVLSFFGGGPSMEGFFQFRILRPSAVPTFHNPREQDVKEIWGSMVGNKTETETYKHTERKLDTHRFCWCAWEPVRAHCLKGEELLASFLPRPPMG